MFTFLALADSAADPRPPVRQVVGLTVPGGERYIGSHPVRVLAGDGVIGQAGFF